MGDGVLETEPVRVDVSEDAAEAVSEPGVVRVALTVAAAASDDLVVRDGNGDALELTVALEAALADGEPEREAAVELNAVDDDDGEDEGLKKADTEERALAETASVNCALAEPPSREPVGLDETVCPRVALGTVLTVPEAMPLAVAKPEEVAQDVDERDPRAGVGVTSADLVDETV